MLNTMWLKQNKKWYKDALIVGYWKMIWLYEYLLIMLIMLIITKSRKQQLLQIDQNHDRDIMIEITVTP